MRIRTYFVLFVLLIALNFVAVHWFSAGTDGFSVCLLPLIWLLTLACLVLFYRKIVKPLRSIEIGMLLLKEQDFSSRLTPVGQYDVDRIVKVFNRMMDRLKNERLRVREQNQFLDLLFHVSPMGILILDLDGKVSSMNPASERFLGISSDYLKGKALGELHLELSDALQALAMEETRTVRLSDSGVWKCAHLSFLDQGFRHSFYLVEPLTEEVMQAEKKAYEKVIRMIAHEVNNTVAGVTSTLDTLNSAMEGVPESDELRDVIRTCMERCYGMSRFITNFAEVVKIPEPSFSWADLNEVVTAGRRFMEVTCNHRRIAIRAELSDEPVRVRLDTVLFQQVLINIVKNAVESIGEGGTIFIRTASFPPSLEIADTGKGINKEDEGKLFTPFFSTKPNGQGIGLMLVREVLMKHGCTFSLRTDAEGLTRFHICFRPQPHRE